ncbi:MAG: TIGR04086 family membrane protein [Planctomycetaceae bacterium]|nr:TIGR04086 family membrane protein [Planctomycetaceae bacterium]
MFRSRISWRAIIAGVVTTIAVSIIMAILGVALGFTVLSPMSSDPLSGLGTAFGIWSVVSVIVSLAAGGFMAGFVGPGRGAEHGFLTWATVLLIAGWMGGQAIGAAASSIGSAVENIGSAAVDVASDVGGGIASLAGSAVDVIQDQVDDMNVNTDELRGDVAQVLRDTGVPTLQPEYLCAQIGEARSDLRSAIRQITLNNEDLDQAIGGFVDRQQARLANITDDIDRDAVVTALMNNRNITRAEAEQLVDNALIAYSTVVDRTRSALENAQMRLQETRAYVADAIRQARIRADELASAMARSALFAGLSLIVGAILACLAGWYGREQAYRRFHDDILESTAIRTGVLTEV